MHLRTLLASLALLATTTLSAPTFAHSARDIAIANTPRSALTTGIASVKNNCPFTLYLWSVSSTISPIHTLAANGTGTPYTEPLHYDPATGIAIKIGTTDNALWTGAPLLHFSYALNNAEGSIYYDLSSAFGTDPLLMGRKFVVKGSKPDVPSIEWTGGSPSGTRAYFGDTDLGLTLCA
jgi:hypothetical protein